MKAKELRELSDGELAQKLRETSREVASLRMRKLSGVAVENYGKIRGMKRDITVAVMGCVVNGPGEAREADYGIAGGRGKGILFKKGVVLGTYPYGELCDRLIALIESDGEQHG